MLASNYDGENRRNFFRVEFSTPLCGEMTIVEHSGKKIDSGSTKICISNLSASGLAFISKLSLPINEDIVLCFKLKILNNIFYLNGNIVRKVPISNNAFVYGVKFLINESYQSDCLNLLNQLSIKLNRNDTKFTGCDFCKKQKKPCT